MKVTFFIALFIISLQSFANDSYVAEQIKNLSASNPKVRVDAANRLDHYFTDNGATVDPEEVDKYINELSKSLQDHRHSHHCPSAHLSDEEVLIKKAIEKQTELTHSAMVEMGVLHAQ
ncbi:MAG: hypothetical protein KJ856_11655 [Gammaproteobacteria bacterium]|nr:hypothetical protein [Gammaproteobacteria bacterium]QYX63989.1 hypothetical protein K2227_17750 [Shewanella putrefaciens]MBU1476567.1 hypothetical protein [Gammaproteobacteria bacterium]MBU2000061.1 hypothetical protein [Gammaproteobacteria bacterium]MBU2133873.1 hypothetical protein [Gammaproteobacteria bacterium]